MKRTTDFIRALNPNEFGVISSKAWGSLARDLGIISICVVLFAYWDEWYVGLTAGIVIGFAQFGLLLIGHDCLHKIFSRNRFANELVGHLCHVMVLCPFEHLRHAHLGHHRYTMLLEKDEAFAPLTLGQYRRLPLIARIIYRATRNVWPGLLFHIYCMLIQVWTFTGKFHKDYPKTKQLDLHISLYATFIYGVVSVGLVYKYFGPWGVFCLQIVPAIVAVQCYAILSVTPHIDLDSCWQPPSNWSPEKALTHHSFNVAAPKWLNWFAHDGFYHLTHHICTTVPLYRLREAQTKLDREFPGLWKQKELTWKHLYQLASTCELVNTQGKIYMWQRFSEKDEAPAFINYAEKH